MNSRRTFTVIAAIVFAATAAAANVVFLSQVQTNSEKDNTLVPIYKVGKETIPRLKSGADIANEKLVVLGKIRQADKPDGAIQTRDQLELLSGMVAISDLSPKLPLTSNMFADPAQANQTAAERVDKDMVAVSLSLDSVHSVGGLLQPGDRVNIVLPHTFVDNPDTTFKESDVHETQMLFQNVRILAIDKTLQPAAGETAAGAGDDKAAAAAAESSNSGLITFEVPPEAASRLIHAASIGTSVGGGLYLELLNPDYRPSDIPIIRDGNAPLDYQGNLFSNGSAERGAKTTYDQRTPYDKGHQR